MLVLASVIVSAVVGCACAPSVTTPRWTECQDSEARRPPRYAPGMQPVFVPQIGHGAAHVTDVAVSRDGRLALSCDDTGAVLLWDVDSGRLLRRSLGDNDRKFVDAVDLAPDGKSFLTAQGTLMLRDTLTGAKLWTHEPASWLFSAKFSPNGRLIATARIDHIDIIDAVTGKPTIEPIAFENLYALAFSPDGRRLIAASWSAAGLWDVATGRSIGKLRGFERRRSPYLPGIELVAFGPGGMIATVHRELVALWDAATGERTRTLEEPGGYFHSVFFSPDGARLITVGSSWSVWDVSTGALIRRREAESADAPALSADGRLLFLASHPELVVLDVATGKEVRMLESRGSPVAAHELSRDGRTLLGVTVGDAWLWDLAAGTLAQRFSTGAEGDAVDAGSISADGRRIVLTTKHALAVFDTATYKRVFEAQTMGYEHVSSLALSGDGSIAAYAQDGKAHLLELRAGGQDHTFTQAEVWGVDLSDNGRTVLIGYGFDLVDAIDMTSGQPMWQIRRSGGFDLSANGEVIATTDDERPHLWEARNGRALRELDLRPSTSMTWSRSLVSVALSPDARTVVSGSIAGDICVWDSETGDVPHCISDAHAGVVTVALSGDSELLATAGEEGMIRLWRTHTGEPLATLIAYADGSWVVLDPEGRYDASNGGDLPGAYFVMGLETIDLAQLKAHFYEPGLLAKRLGLSNDPLSRVPDLRKLPFHPEVRVTPSLNNPSQVAIDVFDNGGGIGKVELSLAGIDGSSLLPANETAGPWACRRAVVDIAQLPQFGQGQANDVKVRAWNAPGTLSSRSALSSLHDDTPASAHPPKLWAIVVGISDYRGDVLDLRYPSVDASAFAATLERGARNFFGAELTEVTTLTSNGGAPVTKDRIHAAFERAKASRPEDVLVVFLAGHGVAERSQVGNDDEFYFLGAETRDARADLADPTLRAAHAISGAELQDWLVAIPARRRVLILDTCAAGQVIEDLSQKRTVSSSQGRALERLQDRTGLWVLAGAASDKVSYEASRYGQGLLTYSLLEGMKDGAALREGELVDVSQLFMHAADRVRELALGVGGVQRPQVSIAPSGSIDIGRLGAEDRAAIPLAHVRPVAVRSVFQDERRLRDHLGLAVLVDAHLRDVSARGEAAPLVFFDVPAFAEAIQVTGLYIVDGASVRVRARIFRGEAEVGAFEVEGAAGDPGALAGAIAGRVEALLAVH